MMNLRVVYQQLAPVLQLLLRKPNQLMLKVKNLKALREDKEILKGINLEVNQGEIHAIMGPNGSGKSTLAAALMGHPDIEVTAGIAELDGVNLLDMEVDARAREGLFLAFQYPVEIPGVPFSEFLRLSYNSVQKKRQGESYRDVSPFKFKRLVDEKLKNLEIDSSFLERNLNEGFSGGEKKKAEILQLAVLEPKYVILDETDSGLDVSALKIVAEACRKLADQLNIGMVVITHYKRILEHLNPDKVHVLVSGKIVDSGGPELADILDKDGYAKYL